MARRNLSFSSKVYTQGYKLGRTRTLVTPLSSGAYADLATRALLLNTRLWTKADHLAAARLWRKRSDKFHTLWGQTQDRAHMETFGKKASFADYRISGIGRDEYSEAKKNLLRKLARSASDASVLAANHERASKYRGLERS